MRVVDKIVLAAFVIALVVLCFFQQCHLDIYCLILGFAVAVMCGVAMFMQRQKKDSAEEE